jgi:Putative zinc-finger
MEHQEAIQLKAAERYLLGELSGDLRDQFEDHFFACVECKQDVESGAVFVDGAREVLGLENDESPVSRPARPESRGWLGNLLRPAFAGPVFAVLLIFAVYQNTVVIPRMKSALSQARAPQVLPWFTLIASNSRGGEPLTIPVRPNSVFGLFVDIPPEKQLPSYTYDVETESGAIEFSVSAPADQAAGTLQLLVPSSRLTPGKQVLVVHGVAPMQAGSTAQVEVGRFPFNLSFAK